MLEKLKKILKNSKVFLSEAKGKSTFTPIYRVVEISKSDEDEYVATIQLVQRQVTFTMKPEEILAQDNLVDCFSPRDIRTLTYIGYLELNNPKYRILAQKLSSTNDEMLFALKKKGEKKILIKTANEISKDSSLINNLPQKDAHRVGYTTGTKHILEEKRQKEQLSLLNKREE